MPCDVVRKVKCSGQDYLVMAQLPDVLSKSSYVKNFVLLQISADLDRSGMSGKSPPSASIMPQAQKSPIGQSRVETKKKMPSVTDRSKSRLHWGECDGSGYMKSAVNLRQKQTDLAACYCFAVQARVTSLISQSLNWK